MNDSILTSIKKLLGIEEEYEHFDTDIIMHINSVFMILSQIGLRDGEDPYFISGKLEKWSDYFLDEEEIQAVKTYIYQRVKLMFDPPQSSIHVEALNKSIAELEWRINVMVENKAFDKQNAYSTIEKLEDYFFYVVYDDIDYSYGDSYFTAIPSFGLCSAIRKDNLFAKSHDWKYDEYVDFVVRTTGIGGRYASLGIATAIDGLTNKFVSSKKYSDNYKAVPLSMTDGINETGLSISINVVAQDKGNNYNVPAAIQQKERMHVRFIPRYILDNFNDAKLAAEYIRDYVTVYMPTTSIYDVHYMVSDNRQTYIIEFEYGETKIFKPDQSFMTNFHIKDVIFNPDGGVYTPETMDEEHDAFKTNKITKHGSGLERYNLINSRYDSITNKDSMIRMVKDLRYTKMYDRAPIVSDPYWYTELVSDSRCVDDNIMLYASAKARAGELYSKRVRDGITWQSTHSSIYDTNDLSLTVFPQETDNRYDFNI